MGRRLPAATALLLALLLGTLVGSCAGERVETPPRALLVITLDTTRLDALGAFAAYGTGASSAGPARTPNLDRLAAESASWIRARAVAPLTLPSHASMFTGLWPPRHTVRGNGPARLPAAATTLAERLRDEGWQTAACVASLALDRAFGLDQGFELYSQPADVSERLIGQISDRPATEVVAEARAWLASRDRERPFFLWVHLFDPHAPYAAPEPFRSAAPTPYLAEVAAMDHALGALLDDESLDLSQTLVLVAGDHGEGLGEHGEATHSILAYDSTLLVPLMLRRPDGQDAGRVFDEVVSVADVFPTVLAELGLAPPELPGGLDGVPLGSGQAGRGVYFESYQGWSAYGMSPLAGWVDGRGKYLHAAVPEFFRPREDPGELRESFASLEAARLEPYRRALARVAAAPALRQDDGPAVDAALIAKLAEQGYGPSVERSRPPAPLEPTERPSPQLAIAAQTRYERGFELLSAGRHEEAARAFEETLAELPRHVLSLDGLTRARIGMEQWEQAVETALRRLALPPESLSVHRDLVLCYTELGRRAEARQHTIRALQLLIETHARRGEHERAEQYGRLLAQALERED